MSFICRTWLCWCSNHFIRRGTSVLILFEAKQALTQSEHNVLQAQAKWKTNGYLVEQLRANLCGERCKTFTKYNNPKVIVFYSMGED